MSDLTRTNTRLIAGIKEIAAYYGKDSDEVMQDLVDTELKRLTPAIQTKREAEQTKREYEKPIKQPVSENFPKISSPEKLKGTKPVEGYCDGVEVKIAKNDWNKMLAEFLKILCEKINIEGEELISLLPRVTEVKAMERIRRGIQSELYQPIEELNISLPSLSAPDIGETIQKLAKEYGISYNFKVCYNNPKFGDTGGYLFTNI